MTMKAPEFSCLVSAVRGLLTGGRIWEAIKRKLPLMVVVGAEDG